MLLFLDERLIYQSSCGCNGIQRAVSCAKESRTRSDDSDYLSRDILEVAFDIVMLVLITDGYKAIVFPNELFEELV